MNSVSVPTSERILLLKLTNCKLTVTEEDQHQSYFMKAKHIRVILF